MPRSSGIVALVAITLLTCGCTGSPPSSSVARVATVTPPAAATPTATVTPTSAAGPSAIATPTPVPATLHGIDCDHLGCQGDLPAGQIATRGFLPGTTFRLADDGWFNTEDEPGEFNLRRVDHPNAAIFLWIDPVPLMNEVPVPNLQATRDGVLRWLQHHPYLTAGKVTKVSLGGDPNAVSLRVAYRPHGPSGPDCGGATCFDLFHFEGPGHNFDYGSGLGEPLRLYLAEIVVGGMPHTMVVSVVEQDPADRAAFPALESAAAVVLATMTVGDRV